MQRWEKWIDPDEFGIPKDLFLDKLTDESDELEIYLTNGEGFKLKVTFPDVVYCYRKLRETFYTRTLSWLITHPESNIIGKTNFCVAYESDFWKWFIEDSILLENEKDNILTYVIARNEDIIEVLTPTRPNIEII